MRIGVFGTEWWGSDRHQLVELGHEVTMGSRSASGEALGEWLGARPVRGGWKLRGGGAARRASL